MGWLRRGREPRVRQELSGPDPVGAALAEAAVRGPLCAQECYPDEKPVLAELGEWIEVVETDEMEGFDTLVMFSDEIRLYVDAYESGLDLILGEQVGVEEVLAEDREIVYLRTRLALEDVRAAVVRSVVEANRAPRERPLLPGTVSEEQVRVLADALADELGEAGFVRHGPEARKSLYFHREGEDGIVQALSLFPGIGQLTDGTDLSVRVSVMFGVHVPELASPHTHVPSDLNGFAVGHCSQSESVHLEPELAQLRRVLDERVLVWLDATRSRRALAAWVAEDPERIFPPGARPRHARQLAQWGEREAARAVLVHLRRRWRSLSEHPDALEAARILDSD